MPNVIKPIAAIGGSLNELGDSRMFKVKAGAAASIKPGYLVIEDDGNAGYVKAAADAYASTTSKILGVASSTSTDTASADGILPSITTADKMVCKMYAKTPANLTQAMRFTGKFILDVTAGAYTLDQATTTNGVLKLVDFDGVSTSPTYGLCTVVISTEW